MIIKSYEQRIKEIKTKSDLRRHIQEAHMTEQRAKSQIRARACPITHIGLPESVAASFDPVGYGRLKKARDTARRLSSNFNRIAAQLATTNDTAKG